MHLRARPNFNDRASKLKSFPFLLAAFSLTIGSPVSAQSEQLDFGPQFKTVLAVARLNADCYGRQPCVVPSRPSQSLQQEIDGANWIGNGGDAYVEGYQDGLARYLIEQKVRPGIDPNFSAADRGRAELALNILGGYWDCLDRQIRLADESELATDAALDNLAEVASVSCSERRVEAMTRIAPDAPDFASFDSLRDGGLPDAGIAEVLHAIQRFSIAYNAGLRGYRHRHAIELIPLPAPIVTGSHADGMAVQSATIDHGPENLALPDAKDVIRVDGDRWDTCTFEDAELGGEQRAEEVVNTAKRYFSIHDTTRTSESASAPSYRGLTQVRYDSGSGGRFATYHLTANGQLIDLIVNAPTSDPYRVASGRREFFERLMEIVAPEVTAEEHAWGAQQLDSVWTQRVRPLPVHVGSYIFSGITVHSASGAHDKLRIATAGCGATGLRFRLRADR